MDNTIPAATAAATETTVQGAEPVIEAATETTIEPAAAPAASGSSDSSELSGSHAAEATAEAPEAPAEAPALTAARLVELLAAAEERGYERARREQAAHRELPLWGNPRRPQAPAESQTEPEADPFLSRLHGSIWD